MKTNPVRPMQGWLSALVAYPLAERIEKRKVREKRAELRRFYKITYEDRQKIIRGRLADILAFAGDSVPYYKDVFHSLRFDPRKVQKDPRYLLDLPYLTKEVIHAQGARLLSAPLETIRHHICKTGGSTGSSCEIYYDQDAVDYAAAVTLYARERIGKSKYKFELHFACRFPGDPKPARWGREYWKCLAMNRSNIFFDRIDDEGLQEIWDTLEKRRPYLIHGHPSTVYALACYIEKTYGSAHAFDVFESSGELLEPYMRETISRALRCRVINRYGLAELGVVAYEFNDSGLRVMESEAWPESRSFDGAAVGEEELVFTGLRNRLMPLIRYRTGDIARVEQRDRGIYLTDLVGRIHDIVSINGVAHATHYVQDVLDHRVGGIQEFQIDLRTAPPTLRLILFPSASQADIAAKIETFWGQGFQVQFVGHDDMVRVGHRAKFRHVVHP